ARRGAVGEQRGPARRRADHPLPRRGAGAPESRWEGAGGDEPALSPARPDRRGGAGAGPAAGGAPRAVVEPRARARTGAAARYRFVSTKSPIASVSRPVE